MATIDDTKNVLVIRIVYDGPALSGKTTSLQALARGVSSTVETPGEANGRTLFFDWVDYVGGLFEGRQIRCQIVSVPGQRELAHRRNLLMDSADAVVLVLDTRQMEWTFGLQWLARTLGPCRDKEPPVGVVLQANKRDEPDAVPRDELRESLRAHGQVAVVESTATNGDGIREAFVLAVRLALDRVRALSASGRLTVGRPDEDEPRALLDRMLAEGAHGGVAVHDTFAASLDASLGSEFDAWHADPPPRPSAPPPPDGEEVLFVPDPMMPGGMIWPPVDGRALLHELSVLGIKPSRTRHQNWCGAGSGFRFHSNGHAIYDDASVARNELIEWARLHAANASQLSTGRAVILADAGGGRLRLWQLVRADAALRERLAAALVLPDPDAVARDIIDVASRLATAREAFKTATVPLPCTLWTVGAASAYNHAFVGLMPARGSRLSSEAEGAELFEREFAPHLRELRRSRVDYREVVQNILARIEQRNDAPLTWLSHVVTAT